MLTSQLFDQACIQYFPINELVPDGGVIDIDKNTTANAPPVKRGRIQTDPTTGDLGNTLGGEDQKGPNLSAHQNLVGAT